MKKKALQQKVFKARWLVVSVFCMPGMVFADDDISRKDLANALINYEANARINEYLLNQELLFMSAPGTAEAAQAGQAVGGASVSKIATQFINNTIGTTFAPLSATGKVNIGGSDIAAKDPFGPLQTYEMMADLFAKGSTAQLGAINSAALIQSTNVGSVGSDNLQKLLMMLTTPYSEIAPPLQAKLKLGGVKDLTGEDKEELGYYLAQYALMGAGTNAWSDMVARRMPAPPAGDKPPKSVMEVMDEHSKARFTNPDWYRAVAASSEPALLREIAHMLSYSSWMSYQHYRLAEQQVSLLAAMNSMLWKANKNLDDMNRELAKARADAAQQAEDLKNQDLSNANAS